MIFSDDNSDLKLSKNGLIKLQQILVSVTKFIFSYTRRKSFRINKKRTNY